MATNEIRILRKQCHDLFDKTWHTPNERKLRYKELADKLGIDVNFCHFAYFNKELLNKALDILNKN